MIYYTLASGQDNAPDVFVFFKPDVQPFWLQQVDLFVRACIQQGPAGFQRIVFKCERCVRFSASGAPSGVLDPVHGEGTLLDVLDPTTHMEWRRLPPDLERLVPAEGQRGGDVEKMHNVHLHATERGRYLTFHDYETEHTYMTDMLHWGRIPLQE